MSAIVACRECDALQRLPERPDAVRPHAALLCHRCGAHLQSEASGDLQRAAALALTAFVLFVLANAYPLVALEMQGNHVETTLLHAVRELWREDVQLVAVLVLVTVILVPMVQIAAMLYVLLPLQFGRVPPHVEFPLRVFRLARPWGMAEVFILGILVSLVKLAHMAHVIPGVAMWAFALLVVVFALLGNAFDPIGVWARIERLS